VQGLAHDDSQWFFTTTTLLLKFPVDFDLATSIDTDDPPAGVQVVGPDPLYYLAYSTSATPTRPVGFSSFRSKMETRF
jgi:hypothetical protein